jgi:hypothetical protein
VADDARARSTRGLLDRRALLERLPPIEYDPGDEADEQEFERASLARALLNLAEVDQEREYLLCRSVADHLLGEIPEPDDLEL